MRNIYSLGFNSAELMVEKSNISNNGQQLLDPLNFYFTKLRVNEFCRNYRSNV